MSELGHRGYTPPPLVCTSSFEYVSGAERAALSQFVLNGSSSLRGT